MFITDITILTSLERKALLPQHQPFLEHYLLLSLQRVGSAESPK